MYEGLVGSFPVLRIRAGKYSFRDILVSPKTNAIMGRIGKKIAIKTPKGVYILRGFTTVATQISGGGSRIIAVSKVGKEMGDNFIPDESVIWGKLIENYRASYDTFPTVIVDDEGEVHQPRLRGSWNTWENNPKWVEAAWRFNERYRD